MSIIELSKKIEDVISKNDLTEIASVLKSEFAISKPEELQKAIERFEDDKRTLQLGVIGRVKVGKSSLLNALVFGGNDILPKAATPMTAALTVLQYGTETKADVEFFTKEDIEDIKEDAGRYERKLNDHKTHKSEELKERKLKKEKKDTLSDDDKKEIEEKALNLARRTLKEDKLLLSSYDQYQKIEKSGIQVEELEKDKSIPASNPKELNDKLLDYVGANGKYMPFTKSVTLTFNQDNLKDIQIIDTPGVNDPVVSREERTRELLKYCDVVLVVSPAWQFLSEEDLDLMDRIFSKEGIKDIYLVASQIDNELYGSEKKEGGGILRTVLDNIEEKLTKLQRDILETLKDTDSEVGDTFDKLINNRVIVSSAVCYSMSKTFDDQESWDDNTKHVWKRLNADYKDFFTDKDTALSSLEKLANISKIQKIIDNVRDSKEQILEKRKEEFINTKKKALLEYKKALQEDITERCQKIKSTDIDEIRKQKQAMKKSKAEAVKHTDEVYKDLVEDLEIDIQKELQAELQSSFKKAIEERESSEDTGTESRRYQRGFWDKRYSVIMKRALKQSQQLKLVE